jgi:hypothetical protein
MSRERAKKSILPPVLENIEKLEKVVEGGNYYGAQQMYKSISARYLSAERYSEALDILQAGACIQLEHGQVICGSELAVLLVETLVKGKISCNEESLDLISKIYTKFPRIPVPKHVDLTIDDGMQQFSEAIGAAKTRIESCSSFLKAAIKWSIEVGGYKRGSPELHDMLAEYIYSESPEVDMSKVSFHFVRGKNPMKFACTLVDFMGKCYRGEDDLAIARATLMYLAMGNLRDANYLMDELKKQVQNGKFKLPQSDLIQFVNYILLTLERDALPLFNMLRQNYKPSIDREPIFNELLDEIAEKFYGVQRKNGLQGMFGDFFKMMGGE